jgi:hypothetical protein
VSSQTLLLVRPSQDVESWLSVDWLAVRTGVRVDRTVGRMHLRVEVRADGTAVSWLPPRRKRMRPVRDAADLRAVMRQIGRLRCELEASR